MGFVERLHIASLIETLTPEEKSDLVNAMTRIEEILKPKEAGIVTIRSQMPGDIGYVIHRHGVIYAREYGFNSNFDAYVARGIAHFIENKAHVAYQGRMMVDGDFLT